MCRAQVLLADREVLQDQVVVVELQNEELKEAVGLLQAEAGATQLLLASCMRRVEEVCVRYDCRPSVRRASLNHATSEQRPTLLFRVCCPVTDVQAGRRDLGRQGSVHSSLRDQRLLL